MGSGEPEALGFVDGLLQLVFLEDAGEVELGAGGGGHGDAVAGGDLVGWRERLGEGGGLVAGVCPIGVVTSIRPLKGRMPQRAAAERWLSTPPVARVAAIHRPLCETTRWPTAYTPR